MAKKSSNDMYKAARTARDIEVLASGDPKKIMRKAKNKLIGRLLGKLKIWRGSFSFFDLRSAITLWNKLNPLNLA
jgi:hypothetical protein